MELHEEIESIEYDVFQGCSCLRNIYTPDIVAESYMYEDWGCDSLQSQFPHAGELEHALQTRFSGLPLHRLCYYQGSMKQNSSLKELGRNLFFGVDRYYPTLDKQDRFGMTPLHILCLSQQPNLQLCKDLVEKSRRNLFIRDNWEKPPGEYSIFNEAQGSEAVLCYLIGEGLSNRLQQFGLSSWTEKVKEAIQDLGKDNSCRTDKLTFLYRLLAKYEAMESTSLLEMALWSNQLQQEGKTGRSGLWKHSP